MPRKATILIYAGDDFERLADLRRSVAVAERNAVAGGDRRLGDEVVDEVKAAQEEYDTFVDAASQRAERWVIQAVGHEEWRRLLVAHPPRKIKQDDGTEVDHPEDAELGVNMETFPRALLEFVDSEDPDNRTILEPSLPASDLRKRLKRLAAGEYDHMWLSAFGLNQGGVSDPKLARFSTVARRSVET